MTPSKQASHSSIFHDGPIPQAVSKNSLRQSDRAGRIHKDSGDPLPPRYHFGEELISFSFLKIWFVFMCMGVFPECMYVHHVCSWCPRKPEEVLNPLELELL